MAYVSQELKKELAPAIKAVLAKYRVKGSIAVRNHSTLVVNLRSGLVDFSQNLNEERETINVNTYHIESNWEGEAAEFLMELKDAMMKGNFDKSDIQSDYFHVGWYVDINVGVWKKPYQCTDVTPKAKGPAKAERAESFLAEGAEIA